MFLNSIDNKPTFTRPDNVSLKDLTLSMFNLKKLGTTKFNVYRVPKDFEMRPDLIAAAVYNDTTYTEIILKYNGISNPFSIKEGDIILVPNLDSVTSVINTQTAGGGDVAAKIIRESYKYIDPTKVPTSNISKFQNRKIVNKATPSLPPNITEEGEEQITYRNGRVYFGQGVETCLQNGMTSSEFITNVIKSKV